MDGHINLINKYSIILFKWFLTGPHRPKASFQVLIHSMINVNYPFTKFLSKFLHNFRSRFLSFITLAEQNHKNGFMFLSSSYRQLSQMTACLTWLFWREVQISQHKLIMVSSRNVIYLYQVASSCLDWAIMFAVGYEASTRSGWRQTSC